MHFYLIIYAYAAEMKSETISGWMLFYCLLCQELLSTLIASIGDRFIETIAHYMRLSCEQPSIMLKQPQLIATQDITKYI